MRRLDRYVLAQFLKILTIALLALLTIFVLVHLMDHVNIYLDTNAAWSEVARFYLLQLPYNALLTLPMAMLVATILSIGELGKHGELTAMKGSGISLYRIAVPILVFAFFACFAMLALGETIVPVLNQRSRNVYDREILEEGEQFENYRGNFVYQNRDGYTYIVRSLFVQDSLGSADQVEIQRKFPDGTFVRINASRMLWEPARGRWVLRDGEMRVFPKGEEERM